MKSILVVLLALVFMPRASYAQDDRRVITTGVPFLLIAADARSSGMGDQGVATPVDAFSQQWNAAKYAFSESKTGIGIAYTPYLRELVNDVNIANLTYFNRLNERSAFAASIRYFDLGEIELRQTADQVPSIANPNEFAIDLSYSLRLSEEFSMAVTGRFINSNLRIPTGIAEADPASTFGADISMFYRSEEKFYNDFNGRWRAGLAVSNIGPKLKYDDAGQENFLPTNFKAGAGFDFIFDAANTLGVHLEFNKLLVPTPPRFDTENGQLTPEGQQAFLDYSSQNAIGAIFSSWTDAPDGLSEELKEITWALGAEYWFEDSFALRLGYFNESQDKGFRKFLTIGSGFKYSAIDIDVSYLFSTSTVQNPLEGTLRFGLTFNIGDNTYIEY
ncbi:type IX secretion system outer membrane channel protein PorV [Psychroflexus sp. YR1-1]|uniref:Type IX secretion system outer membrane channel protein PorV n=1 Tax=Psychroflexus aurantiacus TaxID=2709310 RepID=A0A6B3R3M2_9FLAO|nr:type IX secretion system outer membrane channel protein PorV [Psychroflexus aurantiacus]NEV95012.1 type IX secretion system outer membrane channel protein PorV [Psychroflexus aurantiacus]